MLTFGRLINGCQSPDTGELRKLVPGDNGTEVTPIRFSEPMAGGRTRELWKHSVLDCNDF